MNADDAVTSLSALAHPHRLKVFRILVREGYSGLSAGDIAARLEISPSALSFHLSHLERAALIRSWREGRSCIYAVNVEGMRGLLTYLTEDCCDGQPELCGGVKASAKTRSRRGAVSYAQRKGA